jgi:MFS transporter, ACS family, glucarate transporter
VPIQIRYGWRASFYLFGLVGLVWAAIWYKWFRDTPVEKHGVSTEELNQIGQVPDHGHSFPWRVAFRSKSVLAMLVTAFCYVYVYTFFQAWFHTFLVKGRGFSEASLVFSMLPYTIAAVANLTGGAVSDFMVRRFGLRWGRSSLGVVGLGGACMFTIAAMMTHQQMLTLVLLSLVYGFITFQQSGVFAVCLDVGRKHAGSIVGLMNTAASLGGLISSVAYGYIVEYFHSYDAPFVPMAALLLLGTILWFKIDASKEVQVEPAATPDTVLAR